MKATALYLRDANLARFAMEAFAYACNAEPHPAFAMALGKGDFLFRRSCSVVKMKLILALILVVLSLPITWLFFGEDFVPFKVWTVRIASEITSERTFQCAVADVKTALVLGHKEAYNLFSSVCGCSDHRNCTHEKRSPFSHMLKTPVRG